LLVEASLLIIFQHKIVVREHLELSVVVPRLVLPALAMAAGDLELPSVSLPITRSPLFALLRH
jgi:hypothetical protein